jgi:hypothetical protein
VWPGKNHSTAPCMRPILRTCLACLSLERAARDKESAREGESERGRFACERDHMARERLAGSQVVQRSAEDSSEGSLIPRSSEKWLAKGSTDHRRGRAQTFRGHCSDAIDIALCCRYSRGRRGQQHSRTNPIVPYGPYEFDRAIDHQNVPGRAIRGDSSARFSSYGPVRGQAVNKTRSDRIAPEEGYAYRCFVLAGQGGSSSHDQEDWTNAR